MASFRGEKYFLSNMYPCPVKVKTKGKVYVFKSSESAFQAFRSPDRFEEFISLDGFAAKRHSKECKRRSDWFKVSIQAMAYVLKCKFTQNRDLAEKLIALEGDIVEINEWHDTFWGVCNGKGENHLGRLLMEIRDELRQSVTSNP